MRFLTDYLSRKLGFADEVSVELISMLPFHLKSRLSPRPAERRKGSPERLQRLFFLDLKTKRFKLLYPARLPQRRISMRVAKAPFGGKHNIIPRVPIFHVRKRASSLLREELSCPHDQVLLFLAFFSRIFSSLEHFPRPCPLPLDHHHPVASFAKSATLATCFL